MRLGVRLLEFRRGTGLTFEIGVEPCTNGFGREAVRKSGKLIVLEPGECRRCASRVTVIESEEADALRRCFG